MIPLSGGCSPSRARPERASRGSAARCSSSARLRRIRLAVGTRSGYPPPDLERYGDRVVSFELDSPDVSSSQVRERVSRGEPIDDLVPGAVAEAISGLGLYRGYTESRAREDLTGP